MKTRRGTRTYATKCTISHPTVKAFIREHLAQSKSVRSVPDIEFIGIQDDGDGGELLLYICPVCGTTLSI